MVGSVYLKYATDLDPVDYLLHGEDHSDAQHVQLENVTNIGVADPFLIINYVDGTTVLHRAEDFESVQFTPYPETDGESPEGQITDNAGA